MLPDMCLTMMAMNSPRRRGSRKVLVGDLIHGASASFCSGEEVRIFEVRGGEFDAMQKVSDGRNFGEAACSLSRVSVCAGKR